MIEIRAYTEALAAIDHTREALLAIEPGAPSVAAMRQQLAAHYRTVCNVAARHCAELKWAGGFQASFLSMRDDYLK